MPKIEYLNRVKNWRQGRDVTRCYISLDSSEVDEAIKDYLVKKNLLPLDLQEEHIDQNHFDVYAGFQYNGSDKVVYDGQTFSGLNAFYSFVISTEDVPALVKIIEKVL